uniref:Protein kinase domain-containing protein n=1 Tax=Oryza brachyantha TaxID=4533 RepID=J3MEU6_ORYBR
MPPHSSRLLLVVVVVVLSTSVADSVSSSSCDAAVVAAAFRGVRNFQAPGGARGCRPVRELRLALANLSGLAVLDLSGNALQGAIPGGFWRAPSLRSVDVSGNQLGGALRVEPSSRLESLNVSGNRFTAVAGMDGLAGLRALDVSANRIRTVPRGLTRLVRLSRLDLSRNSMQGRFPGDLPPLGGLGLLNVSYNNFSGVVDGGAVKKFGHSAFAHAGNASLLFSDNSTARRRPPPPPSHPPHRSSRKNDTGTPEKRTPTMSRRKHLSVVTVAVACGVVSVAMLLCLVGCVACGVLRCRKRRGKEEEEEKKAHWGGKGEDEVVAVAAAAAKGGSAAPTACMLDLSASVSPTVGAVRWLGKDKLLLYEYMERGDLHRWLHELPAGRPDMEDDADADAGILEAADQGKRSISDWPTRHRIALGVARGLAFLHQGWAGSSGRRPVVHGHLVPANVLLGEDLEPRISDFGGHPGDATAESDVYSFGVLVLELMTGQAGWDEASVSWARGIIRDQKGLDIVDPRVRDGAPEAEREMVACLRVGYLCTAQSPDKRPTMQQVVGLLKDIRAAPATPSSP